LWVERERRIERAAPQSQDGLERDLPILSANQAVTLHDGRAAAHSAPDGTDSMTVILAKENRKGNA
jgi:hypothetical protein